jgi:hypothetical protein
VEEVAAAEAEEVTVGEVEDNEDAMNESNSIQLWIDENESKVSKCGFYVSELVMSSGAAQLHQRTLMIMISYPMLLLVFFFFHLLFSFNN